MKKQQYQQSRSNQTRQSVQGSVSKTGFCVICVYQDYLPTKGPWQNLNMGPLEKNIFLQSVVVFSFALGSPWDPHLSKTQLVYKFIYREPLKYFLRHIL